MNYMQTPDHDFAPEPTFSNEEIKDAHDHLIANEPEILETVLDYFSGVLNKDSLAARLDYLGQRCLEQALDMLNEQRQDRGAA